MKNVKSSTLWLAIIGVAIMVQAYSAFGQEADITGKWKDGSVGSVQYHNQVTGATRSGRSHIFTYTFLPNGNYQFIGYMELNMYGCASTLFNEIAGKYTVEGSTINLNPSKDFWKSTNSCAASGNKQTSKTPTRKTLEFERGTDDYGKDLLCITDGEARTCYGREK